MMLLLFHLKGDIDASAKNDFQRLEEKLPVWHPDSQEKSQHGQSDARRYSPLIDGLLPPSAGVENGNRGDTEGRQGCGGTP